MAIVCASPEERAAAQLECNRQSVKGLDGVYTSGKFVGLDPCAVAQLPDCKNIYGGGGQLSKQKQDVLWAPLPGGGDGGGEQPTEKTNYLLWGGLLLLVIAGGSYAYYKAQKKAPKKKGRKR